MFNSQALRMVRKLTILGILTVALWFLMFDRSVISVRAESCYDATEYLSTCYTNCDFAYDVCIANNPSYPDTCRQIMQNCLVQCEDLHSSFGLTCGFAPYSHPLDPNDACNGQQVFDNCIAGSNVPLNVRNVYISCMADNGGDVNAMYGCCEATEDAYLTIGCY